MTKLRQAVLDILGKAEGPMAALDIAGVAGEICDTATIYRSLHYLEDQGLADSFVLSCTAHGTERYYVSHGASHRHWFHCERCHTFVDMGECRIEPLIQEMGKVSGVHIRSHTLYATGICDTCLSHFVSA